jgi:hypothetical protein
MGQVMLTQTVSSGEFTKDVAEKCFPCAGSVLTSVQSIVEAHGRLLLALVEKAPINNAPVIKTQFVSAPAAKKPDTECPSPFRYIVKLHTPDGETFYRDGSVNERDSGKATRLNGYRDALLRMAVASGIWRLDDPAAITIQVAPECIVKQKWTVDEILRREG